MSLHLNGLATSPTGPSVTKLPALVIVANSLSFAFQELVPANAPRHRKKAPLGFSMIHDQGVTSHMVP